MIQRTGRTAGLACFLILTACTSNPSSTAGPSAGSPSPTPPASPSPAPSPSPEALQRAEQSLPAPVEETAAATAGGKLYVMGGFNAAGESLSTVYVFDGLTWSAGPKLPLPLDHPSAATLDDRVYISGGHSNGRDSARVFRLDGDRWSEVAPMQFARGGHALVAAAGRLYAIGGNTGRANVAAAEAYDPAANAWTLLPALPQPRNHVAGFTLDGLVCVAGGRSPTTPRVDCLDVASHAWARFADLPRASSGGGAVTVGEMVIAAGGEDASETRIIDQLVFYSAARWGANQRMLSPRHGFELAMFEGRAWACGGGSAPGLHPVAACTSLGDPSSPNG